MPQDPRRQRRAELDKQLFQAWQSGDQAAFQTIWEHLWSTMFSVAVAYCRSMGYKPEDAVDGATDAVNDAWIGIDSKLRAGYRWTADSSFVSLVESRVILRCKDWRRRKYRWTNGLVDLPGVAEEQGDDFLERLVPVEPTQGADALVTIRTQEEVDSLVCRLAARREICRGQPALAQLIDAQLAYVRECVARTVEEVDTSAMTLDELIPLMNRGMFDASKADMNRFIMARLRITRNTLDTRQADIRALVAAVRPKDPEDNAVAAL